MLLQRIFGLPKKTSFRALNVMTGALIMWLMCQQCEGKVRTGNGSLNEVSLTSLSQSIVANTNSSAEAIFQEKRKKACADHGFGDIRFIQNSRAKRPPLLLSFPGSGNTWTRLLIEYATGHYTGSTDVADKELEQSFPGEVSCNCSEVVIKAHPVDMLLNTGNQTVGFETDGKSDTDTVRFGRQKEKCRVGGINEFDRVIFIARDPYPAIFSDFQRDYTNSHVGAIVAKPGARRPFSLKKWRFHAGGLASIYDDKWKNLVAPIVASWGSNRIVSLRYEDLLNPTTRIEALQKVVAFLGYTTVSPARLECAFVLAEKPHVSHRQSKMDAELGYAVAAVLICQIWEKAQGFSQHFNYPIWKNNTCP